MIKFSLNCYIQEAHQTTPMRLPPTLGNPRKMTRMTRTESRSFETICSERTYVFDLPARTIINLTRKHVDINALLELSNDSW